MGLFGNDKNTPYPQNLTPPPQPKMSDEETQKNIQEAQAEQNKFKGRAATLLSRGAAQAPLYTASRTLLGN